MACLIKAPDASGKGCVSFTTPERDMLIGKSPEAYAAVAALKNRFIVGLHHNWHDHAFSYNPLFDFSMAGDGDLQEVAGRSFCRVPLDACNFAPEFFSQSAGADRYWDVLCTSRAVFFKGLPEFLQAIREIYDSGRLIRVLHLCPVPPKNDEGTHLHDIRQRFEGMFSPAERRYFNLMTMEWDNPFPLDLETLAFFYRSSRIYVHSAPQERRARAAAYALAARMPVVSRENIASILPEHLRRRPFWFEYDEPAQMADAILAALDSGHGDPSWDAVSSEFSSAGSAKRLESALQEYAKSRGERLSGQPINSLNFDIRLGRHHSIGGGTNQVDQGIEEFCSALLSLSDTALMDYAQRRDPEADLALLTKPSTLPSSDAPAKSIPAQSTFQNMTRGVRRLFTAVGHETRKDGP